MRQKRIEEIMMMNLVNNEVTKKTCLGRPHYTTNIIGILDGEEFDIGSFGMRKNYIG